MTPARCEAAGGFREGRRSPQTGSERPSFALRPTFLRDQLLLQGAPCTHIDGKLVRFGFESNVLLIFCSLLCRRSWLAMLW